MRPKKLNNYNKINNKDYIPYEQFIYFYREYGLCPKCGRPNTYKNWCKKCYSEIFQQNFSNWTSGNDLIDKFIQETQLNANSSYELLEWIPYDRLKDVKFLAQGGFSTIYEAIWEDGRIINWDYEKQNWKRKNTVYLENSHKNDEKNGYWVILKCLNDSSNINDDFLKEVSNYCTLLNNYDTSFIIILIILKYSGKYI
jgi:hypothetical protein